MKRTFIFMAIAMTVLAGCQKEDYGWVKTGIDRACSQLLLTAENIDGTGQMPRSIWVGYDMDMLTYQLGKEVFKDSLRAHPSGYHSVYILLSANDICASMFDRSAASGQDGYISLDATFLM